MNKTCTNKSKTARFEGDSDSAASAKLMARKQHGSSFETSSLHPHAAGHVINHDIVREGSPAEASPPASPMDDSSSVLCLPEWMTKASAQHAEIQRRKLLADNYKVDSVECNPVDDFDELLLAKVRVAFMIAGQLVAEEEAVEELMAAGGGSDVPFTKRLSSRDVFVHFKCNSDSSSGQDWFQDDSFRDDSTCWDVDDMMISLEQSSQQGTLTNEFASNHDSGTEVLSSKTRQYFYLSVNSVELHHGSQSIRSSEYARCRSSLEKYNLLRLQSLGLVLYELFTDENFFGENCDNNDSLGLTNENGGKARALDAIKNTSFESALNLNHKDDDEDNLEGLFQTSSSKKKRHSINFARKLSSSINKSRPEIENISDSLLNTDITTFTATLRLSGLPVSLCDLIANLIECSEGEFASNIAYQQMCDVRNDLRLKAFHPEKYLRDVDVSNVTTLPLGKSLFGRQTELNTLVDAYKTNLLGGECRAAFISGTSGVGKSKLAEKIRDYVDENMAYFVGSKFDQLRQLKPFSALFGALNEFCTLVANDLDRDELDDLRKKILSFFGNKIVTLVTLVPDLREIIDVPHDDTLSQADLSGRKRQLEYLLREFIHLVLKITNKHVTFFMDDLQWADESSVSLLKSFLDDNRMKKNFFLLGCYRDDAFIDDTNALSGLISKLPIFGTQVATIHLEGLTRESVEILVSDTLCLSPRLTRSLAAVVFNITQGNPLFVEQVLMSMCESGLLHLSLSSRRWEWDEEKIHSMEMPASAVQIMIENILKLPSSLQDSLRAASYFGSSISKDVAEIISVTLGMDLMLELESAVAKGFMREVEGRYQFTHDRIQQVAYETIDPSERDMNHFKFGLALSAHVLVGGDDELLFISVDQVNRGGPACVTESGQKEVIARLNLSAGEKVSYFNL